MAIDGNWNLKLCTPIGERTATVSLAAEGNKLTGTQAAEGRSGPIAEGTVNGNAVAWKVSITDPMPMTIAFVGSVDGDAMTGRMDTGAFGSFPFTGTRA